MKIETFRRDDGFVRYDTPWYGVGKMTCCFFRNTSYPGVSYFLNCYRTAPVSLRIVNHVGAFRELPWGIKKLFFTGSIAEPYAGWNYRVGRFYLGGRTPKWMLKAWMRWQRWRWLREAKRTREGLCPKCKNGLITEQSGYPGETFIMCDSPNCHHVEATFFDRSAIE